MEENGNVAVSPSSEEEAQRFDVEVVPTAPEEPEVARSRRARTLRRVFMTLLAAFIALGLTGRLGVHTATTTASRDGYELTVTYAKVSRPGLPTPWSLELRRAGGFDGPITISTSSAYFELFDENGFDPQPSRTTATADEVIWEFEPPPGDTLGVFFDARIEPGMQSGESGRTSVWENGRRVVTAGYRTWLMP